MREYLPQPRLKSSPHGIFTSYEIPQRTNTVKVYPIQSPNGSTIILIGHENGVKVMWRGGRPFKPYQLNSTTSHDINGSGHAAMLVDSDGKAEKTPIQTQKNHTEFMEDEEEYDPSCPYPRILQALDLNFKSSVLHLAILSPSTLKTGELVRMKSIIFVAACADNSLRLVTLPLTPPSPLSNDGLQSVRTAMESVSADNGIWGEEVYLLNGHNKPSNCVAMTIDPSHGDPHYLIASCSSEVNGRLLLWRSSLRRSYFQTDPFQSIYLASPARAISFNPSPSRPKNLLIAETTGVCRIYDYSNPMFQAGAVDTLSSSPGSWLLSIMTFFPDTKNKSVVSGAHAGFGRKTIADAQWVLDGCAILVLLNDGEWGIWDIEGISMGMASSQGLLNYHGIKGGSKTEFSLTGFVDSSSKVRSSNPPQIKASKFVPITPGTRKSVDLFSSQVSIPLLGQISVIETPTSFSSRRTDESLLFRVGESFAVIPSILKYWTSYFGKEHLGSVFGNDPCGRIIKVHDVFLQGERCSAVEIIPSFKMKINTTVPEMIILGEHRFVILNSKQRAFTSSTEILSPSHSRSNNLDLTGNNQLDLIGIEMALDQMEEKDNRRTNKMIFSNNLEK